jgi:two-component system sensor histidine kinase QseC
MRGIFQRTLALRGVVVVLLAGFPLVWAALLIVGCLKVWQQQQREGSDFASSQYGSRLQIALRVAEEPAQARAIAAALDQILTFQWRSQGVPGLQLSQVWDRREQRLVFSSPSIADTVLRGDPTQRTIEVLHGQTYEVFEVDTPRWSVLWARAPFEIPWVLSNISHNLVANMAIAFPCVLLLVWLAVSQGLRPLRRLSERIAAREPEDTSPVGIAPRHAELKPLVRALDELLAKLRGKIEAERVFVASAAHELRTPLAVITAQAHVLSKAALEPERADAERRLEAAIARASHLIHQLLALARMEMERPVKTDALDLAQLAREELTHFFPAALARDIEIDLEAPDRLILQLEAHAFQSILQNLIDNAIRYGCDGGRVVVELDPSWGAVRLSVADDGPGIADNDRARIFDRFYRGARRDGASGTGLGLTIVKQAATRMGGTLHITIGLDGRGCRFTVVIPEASASGVKVL